MILLLHWITFYASDVMFLDRIKKLFKTTEHKIRDEKPQYNIYREKYQKYQHYH